MTERPGRKALFTEGLTEIKAVGEEPAGASIPELLYGILHAGLEGDFTARLPEDLPDPGQTGIARTINSLFERMEAEVRSCESAKADRDNFSVIYEHITRQNPLPVLILDPAFTIISANEAFSRLSGINHSDLMAMNYRDFPLSEKKGQGIEEISKFGRFGAAEVTFDLPSGRHVLWQYGIPVPVKEGGRSQLLLIYFDISGQKEEEAALKKKISELEKESAELRDRVRASVEVQSTTSVAPAAAHQGSHEEERSTAKTAQKPAAATSATYEVVEFELGGEKYAIDINCAREIVEMLPITPIPRSPPYLQGIMNLRGEITNIININSILGVQEIKNESSRKIIVLSSDATGGENIGIVVDDVHSVIVIKDSDVEHLDGTLSGQSGGHIKGIIKLTGKIGTDRKGEIKGETDLVIWIDILKVLQDLVQQKKN